MGRTTDSDPWLMAAWLALVLGDGLALALLPASGVILLALFGGIAGSTLAGIRCVESFPGRDPVPSNRRVAVLGAGGLLAAAGCVGAAGLIAAFGFYGLVALAVLGACSPPVRNRLPRSADRDTAVDDVTLPVRPDTAGYADLFRRWTITQRELTEPAFRSFVHTLADARAGILDELEQRDPHAFARWIASGPSAAHDPRPFFVTDGDTGEAPGDAA